MNEEQDLKLTDLDYLIGNHHLQMMKAALPFMNVSEQKLISLFIKFNELQRTITLFEDSEVGTLGICSLEKQPTSPLDMLTAIKEYGNTYEQDFIDVVINFIQGSRIYQSFQSTTSACEAGGTDKETDANENNGNPFRKFPLDQLKNIMPPEQQARLETIQLLMQTMQQFT